MTSSETEILVRDKDGAAMLGCSPATFWRRVADGTIPPPIKIGGMSRWPREEILAVIERAKSQRSQPAGLQTDPVRPSMPNTFRG